MSPDVVVSRPGQRSWDIGVNGGSQLVHRPSACGKRRQDLVLTELAMVEILANLGDRVVDRGTMARQYSVGLQ
jgi:hypothetical protein